MGQKILIFDFDGTLADSIRSFARVYNAIARENNYKLITKENAAALRNMSALGAMHYLEVPALKLPFISKRVRIDLKSEISNLKTFARVKESLQLLREKGYKIFILSSNSKENIENFLRQHQIEAVDGIYSDSDLFGKHRKIKNLLKANNWDASRVMYIGDEVRDIHAAKKAGVIPVSVSWGYNSEDVLAKNNPGVLLSDPVELSSL